MRNKTGKTNKTTSMLSINTKILLSIISRRVKLWKSAILTLPVINKIFAQLQLITIVPLNYFFS